MTSGTSQGFMTLFIAAAYSEVSRTGGNCIKSQTNKIETPPNGKSFDEVLACLTRWSRTDNKSCEKRYFINND